MYALQERRHQIPDDLKIQKYVEIIYNFLTKLYNDGADKDRERTADRQSYAT